MCVCREKETDYSPVNYNIITIATVTLRAQHTNNNNNNTHNKNNNHPTNTIAKKITN